MVMKRKTVNEYLAPEFDVEQMEVENGFALSSDFENEDMGELEEL